MTTNQRQKEIDALLAAIREAQQTFGGNYARKRERLDTLHRALAELMGQQAA